MKHILLTTIAAVLVVGCGPSVDIHEAAAFGNIEAIKQHLAADVDVNAKDRMGWTPLCEAAINGHKEIAELLLANGADVNVKDDRGMTPLDWAIKQIFQTRHSPAVQQKHTEVADLLRKHGGKTADWFKAGESIHIAASEGHIEAVKTHLAAGVDVNLKANDSWTPLQYAAWFGRKEIAELLIAKGADVNAKDASGKTPLDLAKRHPETADLLRKNGGKTGEELKAEGK
jgi:ankyrin repeat protein